VGQAQKRATQKVSRLAGLIVFAVFLMMALLEVGIRVVLYHPVLLKYLPNRVLIPLRDIYANQIRNIVQDDPSMVSFDPVLFDRLRPGRSRFSNVEFNTILDINSRGARDSESALNHPQVVLVGDSISMGWGLSADQTIAHVIEERTGFKTLNAGVSGYGTVRQMKFLDLLHIAAPRFLIVQYGYYHVFENEAYFLHSNSLPIPDQATFKARLQEYRRERGWYSQFYSLGFLHFAFFSQDNWNFSKPEKGSESIADLFLNVLQHELRPEFSQTQLIVFETDYRSVDRFLIPQLDRWLSNPPLGASAILRHMMTVHLRKIIRDDDFYVLDEHLSARGARKVGDAISEAILKSASAKESGISSRVR